MSIKKIPLDAVQKIRQYIKSALVLPESENHPELKTLSDSEDELLEPDSLDALGDLFKFATAPEEAVPAPNTQGRWFISAVNPGSSLAKLPGLQLKSGFRMVGYLHRTADSGTGVTYAIPEDLSTTAQLEKALAECQGSDHPPYPSGALADFMQAIEGDFSPPSLIIAAILRRELLEFGALGKYCDWSHHRLISTIPAQVSWRWRTEVPKDLSPKVLVLPDDRAAVEFFTCRVVTPVAIYRHVDQYAAKQYTANSASQVLATA